MTEYTASHDLNRVIIEETAKPQIIKRQYTWGEIQAKISTLSEQLAEWQTIAQTAQSLGIKGAE